MNAERNIKWNHTIQNIQRNQSVNARRQLLISAWTPVSGSSTLKGGHLTNRHKSTTQHVYDPAGKKKNATARANLTHEQSPEKCSYILLPSSTQLMLTNVLRILSENSKLIKIISKEFQLETDLGSISGQHWALRDWNFQTSEVVLLRHCCHTVNLDEVTRCPEFF